MEEIINCKPRKLRKRFNKKIIKRRIEKNKIDIIVKSFENNDKIQTVIVKKVSFPVRVLEILMSTIFKVIHITLWVGVCGLITIGINTLLNSQLREQILNACGRVIGG